MRLYNPRGFVRPGHTVFNLDVVKVDGVSVYDLHMESPRFGQPLVMKDAAGNRYRLHPTVVDEVPNFEVVAEDTLVASDGTKWTVPVVIVDGVAVLDDPVAI